MPGGRAAATLGDGPGDRPVAWRSPSGNGGGTLGPVTVQDGHGAAGVELAYEVHPGRGPYALFVHGILSTRSTWLPNLAALGEVCTPVVVELWGHGRAATPSEPEPYAPDGYVAQFEALRIGLGVERWAVCGQSLGGALSLRYALTCPDVVTAVAFTNSSSALGDAVWAEQAEAFVAKEADALERAGRPRLDRSPFNPARSRRIAPDVRERLVVEWAEHDPVGIANTMRWTSRGTSVRARLGELVPPALLVHGTDEKAFRPLAAAAVAELPALEVVAVPAGHAVNLHDPEGFNRAVVAFFQRSVQRSADRPPG